MPSKIDVFGDKETWQTHALCDQSVRFKFLKIINRISIHFKKKNYVLAYEKILSSFLSNFTVVLLDEHLTLASQFGLKSWAVASVMISGGNK